MAKAWGLTPRQWRAESADDRALMMAFEMFEGQREAYRQEWREERRTKEAQRKANARTGGNDFERLKAMMQTR